MLRVLLTNFELQCFGEIILCGLIMFQLHMNQRTTESSHRFISSLKHGNCLVSLSLSLSRARSLLNMASLFVNGIKYNIPEVTLTIVRLVFNQFIRIAKLTIRSDIYLLPILPDKNIEMNINVNW